ncbi:tetratricopeptide repeat-containing sensor histidine kinase [Siansivirga zeaxanthinifaciens]|uniref:histidine kinase n=1 Tax=Siansivirga zeaxanthinifaciens CC-SAMT-1 TaxID=1454006 RepID=A0A0C5W5C8_9FLAO|nr:tetratricopeptide repeat-containing sensor histidine kinase [Siansivirga zeaxanthinifaciens]AJR02338.1 histidine kinase [Siansivirga zeaxanthinifaciens CC-SAMT-1]
MRQLLVIFCLFSFFYGQSQTSKQLDSLLKVSKIQKDTTLLKTFNEISWEYRNIRVDSALWYAKKSLELSKKLKQEALIALSYHNIAAAFEANTQLDSAQVNHKKSLDIRIKIKDSIGIADSYNNLGILEDTKGHYDIALKHYFKALNIYEKCAKDFTKVPATLVNIGIVYKKQKEYTKVLDYYKKALNIYKEHNFEIGEAIITGNIGSVLLYTLEYETSIKYSEKAKVLYSNLGYSRYLPYMQANIAIAQDSLKQHTKARSNFLSAISSFKADNNLYELARTQIALANNYTINKEYELAKTELSNALQIIEANNFKEFKVPALKQLAKIDALTKDYKSAYNNHIKYAQAKDSLFEIEKTKTIYELETKYESEKKQKEILTQRAEIAEKELNINQKNTQIIGLLILALVIGVLGYLLFNQQKLKNIQLKKEGQLKEALIKIETQNKLQEQRLRISRDLHDNIGAQLTFIISSIDNLQYGFKITNEKLTNKLSGISAFTKETINELRDTIWAMNKSEITLEDLQVRISNFLDKAHIASNKINFKFHLNTNLSNNYLFTSVQGMSIYRIIQEAINNALKYANASNIEVRFTSENHHISISIIDDGIGFNMEEVSLGNGLNNIKKRAADIGAVVQIESTKDQGTKIHLSL